MPKGTAEVDQGADKYSLGHANTSIVNMKPSFVGAMIAGILSGFEFFPSMDQFYFPTFGACELHHSRFEQAP